MCLTRQLEAHRVALQESYSTVQDLILASRCCGGYAHHHLCCFVSKANSGRGCGGNTFSNSDLPYSGLVVTLHCIVYAPCPASSCVLELPELALPGDWLGKRCEMLWLEAFF